MTAKATGAAASLRFAPGTLLAIHRHAADAYPDECCGFLLGGVMEVQRVVAAANVHRERATSFTIDPEVVLATHKEARAEGLDVVGFYHSHPDAPARPSAHDARFAWPRSSYLIVSVRQGEVVETRSWRVCEAANRDAGAPPSFEEILIDVQPGACVA